ncbi:MAG TPA: hypothetical protein VFY39_16270 [Gammaproteobacteria bacterium]|nr:hypothetical protein [Gammaproteobacteria bacterium]
MKLARFVTAVSFIQLAAFAALPAARAQSASPASDAVNGQKSDQAAAPALRRQDGTVDLGGNGVWSLPYITNFADHLVGIKDVPFLPWSKALWEYNRAQDVKFDPEGFCLPPGGPRAFATPYPAQFIQEKDRIVVIFEGGAHVWRQIFMDGRPHPTDLIPTYFGHSVGHWEGDTLVVDTVGFNEKSWVDYNGHNHTDQLHTIERITRPNLDTLHYEATIIDPGAYSKPWTVAWNIPWHAGQDLAEYICQENNRYLLALKDDYGMPFFQHAHITSLKDADDKPNFLAENSAEVFKDKAAEAKAARAARASRGRPGGN